MKTDFGYLPSEKQAELKKMLEIIPESIPAEMIILFGSYARNNWVEEKYDDEHYRYQSDFDLLVIIENKSEFAQAKFERELEDKIEQSDLIKTPVSIIVHDIEFVNKRLSKAEYFFADIKKEGILLYDSQKYQLSETKELLPKERKKLAQEDFDYWMDTVNEFWIDFNNAFHRGSYKNAAFMLHQVTERLYCTILLVFTRYKPNSHDLSLLRKLVNSIDNQLASVFVLEDSEQRRLFKLLKKAYIEARYKRGYIITQEELTQLAKQVEELKKLGKQLCLEKINCLSESES